MTVDINIQTDSSAILIPAEFGPVVVRLVILAVDQSTSIQFEGTDGQIYAGPFPLEANGSFYWGADSPSSIDDDDVGVAEHFRTDNGTGLVISQTGGATIGGIIGYTRG